MTVSLTLTFADLAQAEQAIAAIRTLNSPATARNEPGAAAETTGDYLRKPMAAASGQIIREGDAPRETGRFGGVASCPDTNQPERANEAGRFESGSLTEILVKPQVQVLPGDAFEVAKGSPTGMGRSDSVERHAPNSRERKPLRPHCQSPDDLSKCAGRGREHCHACRKAMAILSEVA